MSKPLTGPTCSRTTAVRATLTGVHGSRGPMSVNTCLVSSPSIIQPSAWRAGSVPISNRRGGPARNFVAASPKPSDTTTYAVRWPRRTIASAAARGARSTAKSPDASSAARNARDRSVASSSTTTIRSARGVRSPCPAKTIPNRMATTIGHTNVKNRPERTRVSTRRSFRASARIVRISPSGSVRSSGETLLRVSRFASPASA
jgi:hypothetical protein